MTDHSTQYLDCAGPIGTERILQSNVQKLHPFDLAGTAQWTGVNGTHAAILHQLRDLILRVRVVAGDKHVERLTRYLSRKKRAGIGGVEGFDHFCSRGNAFAKSSAEDESGAVTSPS